MAALDMYAEQEQWEKCLEVAAKQVNACVSPRGSGTGSWLTDPGAAAASGRAKWACLWGARELLQQLTNISPLSLSWPVRPSREVLEPRGILGLNFVINGALEKVSPQQSVDGISTCMSRMPRRPPAPAI